MKKFKEFETLVQQHKQNNFGLIIHNNPDPDAVASAYALSFLLQEKWQITSTIIYGGKATLGRTLNRYFRHNNIKIVEESRVNKKNLKFIYVDCIKDGRNVMKVNSEQVIAEIDHHQVSSDNISFSHIEEYGSCSSIITHYLQYFELLPRLEEHPHSLVATALLYGILMDTNNFSEYHSGTSFDLQKYLLLTKFGNEKEARYHYRNQLNIDDFQYISAAFNTLEKITQGAYLCELKNSNNRALKPITAEYFLDFVDIDFICVYQKVGNTIEFCIRNERLDLIIKDLLINLNTFDKWDCHSGGRKDIGAGKVFKINKQKFTDTFIKLYTETN